MKLLLIIAALLPVYLYSILSTVTITYDVTIAFTLISLLSLAIVGAIATLSKGNK
jgi:VIT1/CCC1 family predicted Fe2+/Mn2+ transporter